MPSPSATDPKRDDSARPVASDTVVFVLDEDAAVRDAVASSLRAAGCRVEVFDSAEQFVSSYRAGQPGCLVVDLDLPGLQGLGFLEALVADPPLPVIATSRRLKRAPAEYPPSISISFLDKPFGVDDLLPLVRAALATHSSQP